MTIGGGALFAAAGEALSGQGGRAGVSMADAPMGERGRNGRYKMPLLPGEQGVKSGGDWVPSGLQSMTNLAGSISETRALGIWERERSQIGLVLRPDLAERLSLAVNLARVEGVDLTRLKDYPELRAALEHIHEECKSAAGANAAREAGINRHTAWEHLSKTGTEIGTPQMNAENRTVRELLDAAGFEIIPELSERVVRNTAVDAAGRFDNIVLHRPTGRLIMADLKTKRGEFWGWMEIDAQLAGYAHADYMMEMTEGRPGDWHYIPGPLEHVDLTEGLVLHMPSDGSEPRLRRADLVEGWDVLRLARQVCNKRSYGKSVARKAESYWPV